MARPKGSRNKKATKPVTEKPKKVVEEPKLPENVEKKAVDSTEPPNIIEKPVEAKTEPVVEDDSGLEDRPFFSVDEAARFLGVLPLEAQLWFDHGHLYGTNDQGFIRVSRESILKVENGPLMAGRKK